MRAFLLVLAFPAVLAIWPKPESLEHGSTVLWLSKDVKIQYNPSTRSSIQTVLDYSRQ